MEIFNHPGKALLIIGGALLITGASFTFLSNIPFIGKLPGDILIERENFKLYFPLTTSIAVSLLLSIIFFIVGRK
ncbi:MAG TPA: DUF2905 domain-containing protein [bacterium]